VATLHEGKDTRFLANGVQLLHLAREKIFSSGGIEKGGMVRGLSRLQRRKKATKPQKLGFYMDPPSP